jgi:hypothetical protein
MHKSTQVNPVTGPQSTQKKAIAMKQAFFLMVAAMAILLSGCTGATGNWQRTSGIGCALISSNTPTPLNSRGGSGLHLTLSPRSSVDIDVEGILDYMQGASNLAPEFEIQNLMDPWIRLEFSY